MRHSLGALLGAGLALGGTAMAQPATDQPDSTQPAHESAQEASTPLLTGPRVEPQAAAPSLIRVGYNGRIERVADAQPEVAALELVDLDADARARIDARLEDRAAFLDSAVLEHYKTLLELYAAFGAGDQGEVIRLYIEFSSHLQPLFEGGGLGRQLASEMPAPTRREYARLLMAYYGAVAQDTLEHPEQTQGDAPKDSADAIRRYKIQLLMEEVGRSFARIIQQKTEEFDEVLAALRLTPERETEVRGMVQQFAQDVGLKPTQEQKRAIFMRLMDVLEPEERQRLLGWVLR